MKMHIVVIVFLLATTSTMAQNIADTVISDYHTKSTDAWKKASEVPTQENWIEALKYAFVYREFSAVNKADEGDLKKLDDYVEQARDKILEKRDGGPVRVERVSPPVTE